MKIYQCQYCDAETTTPKEDGWKQLVHSGPGITIKIVVCADCVPTNKGENN
ncbi:MAG: hypothetical protein ACRDT3_01345 [Glutamicibacter sp.]